MKKILVTGGFGSVGLCLLKYLLSEGKYEITVLDLDNKKNNKLRKKYQNRVNIFLGDINDISLIEESIQNKDVIIHLASVMPPFSNISKNIGELIEYNGTENIIKAINYYNPNCYMLYASTTSLYDYSLSGSVKEKINESDLTNYSLVKYKVENLIKKKLKNYTIIRVPLILSNIKKEPFMFNVKKNSMVEVSTNYDVAYAFVKSIEYKKELNKKIFNIGMGINGRVLFKDLMINILKNYGISMKYLLSRLFLEKNYRTPVLTDSDDLENIIHYRQDTLNNYYKRLYNRGRKRVIERFLAKPIIYFMNKKG